MRTDVGYKNFVNNVVNEYFTSFFPLAIRVADQLRNGGFVENFIYTTQPWLVSLYVNCPPDLVLAGVKLKVKTDNLIGQCPMGLSIV